jgi:hypothetical protein
MKTKSFIAVVVSVLFLFSMFAPLFASANVEMAPRIHVKDGTSTNWSGYAALAVASKKGETQTVTEVKGSWTVPAVSGSGTAYSSFWIGIDGYSSNTVEQIGTDSNVINGVPQYSAWYEIYPKYPLTLTMTITPGDVIKTEVSTTTKGVFTLTIIDTSTKPIQTFTTTQKCPQAAQSSAEWIAEAPWSSGVLPLADFGKVTFTGCSATIGSTSGSISRFNNDAINMVTSSGALKASTSGLSKAGATFSVTWESS